ncbi:hypothetical protein RHSIM_Rhsim13G0151100 [Rhododendron simsii]|uniref:Pyridoxal phosphate homeostasis protein n=1 Tax=Rhododendron simsii TaxID=118357 RepID=A0A834G1A9_RHOSS|nr:hypothetical protein RHSIM_Rhsim13G0151100 [Rhododendron simsii]
MNNHEANNRDRQIEDDPSIQEHQHQHQPGSPPMAASAMDGVAATALRSVLHRVHQAAERSGRSSDRIRVVAVSKTKPVSLVRQVYDAGHRCFGENYVQEILEKAPQLPEDIEWHFIGNLQSNKVKPLLRSWLETLPIPEGVLLVRYLGDPNEFPNAQITADPANSPPSNSFLFYTPFCDFVCVKQEVEHLSSMTRTGQAFEVSQLLIVLLLNSSQLCMFVISGVPNLAMVETVDDQKIANNLNRVVENIERKPLRVLVQVNTSGEESKFGVHPSGCLELVKHVSMACPNLEFCGLMTIGMPDYTSTPENFKVVFLLIFISFGSVTLASCRSEVCEALGIAEEQCELSMGMSGDFELAVELGSTNVRIGSTIFGAREYPKKQSN